MPKPIPMGQRKFKSGALKFFVIFLGILILISSFAAIIVSFVAFWEASCDACSEISCDSRGQLNPAGDMDWSFLWLDAYFIVAVIVGPILIAVGGGMVTKKSYLKSYPYAAFCPNCGTLCDKRYGACPKCGADVDPNGEYKFYASQNPYDTSNPNVTFAEAEVEKPDDTNNNQ